jgi:hypothetical protein
MNELKQAIMDVPTATTAIHSTAMRRSLFGEAAGTILAAV